MSESKLSEDIRAGVDAIRDDTFATDPHELANWADRAAVLELDAARYRALREQDWDGKALATVEHGEWVPPGAVAFDDFADALRGETEEPPDD